MKENRGRGKKRMEKIKIKKRDGEGMEGYKWKDKLGRKKER